MYNPGTKKKFKPPPRLLGIIYSHSVNFRELEVECRLPFFSQGQGLAAAPPYWSCLNPVPCRSASCRLHSPPSLSVSA